MSYISTARRNNHALRLHPYGGRPQATRSNRSISTQLDQVQRRLDQLHRNSASTSNIASSQLGENHALWTDNPRDFDLLSNPFSCWLLRPDSSFLANSWQAQPGTNVSRTATSVPARSSLNIQNENESTQTVLTIPSTSVQNNPPQDTSSLTLATMFSKNYPARKTEDKFVLAANVAVPEDIIASFGPDGLNSGENEDATDEEELIFQKVLQNKMKCDFCMIEQKKFRCAKCFYAMCEECTDNVPRPHPWAISCPQCKESQNGFLYIRVPRF